MRLYDKQIRKILDEQLREDAKKEVAKETEMNYFMKVWQAGELSSTSPAYLGGFFPKWNSVQTLIKETYENMWMDYFNSHSEKNISEAKEEALFQVYRKIIEYNYNMMHEEQELTLQEHFSYK